MTKEEAIKVLDQVRQWTDYPKEAFTMAIDALSQPSLPSNLDEAAEKYANKEYPDEASCGQWGTGDYESPVDMEYPREVAKDSFKAGAEWMAEQGEVVLGSITRVVNRLDVETLEYLPEESEFVIGDKVIVQIRKID